MKTLICVVSYQAEDKIEQVLRRLPKDVWRSDKYHVLLSDDASTDDTVKKADSVFQKMGANYSIIRLHKNQGYGGNQKVCYRYAITHGYDAVVLLHGDGQYAPELITRFSQRIETEDADVVLGSRMIDKTRALRGKMPRYKFCANIVLTWLQNRLSKQRISEYHTGYRAYKTSFLKSIPFEMNSDDFHFDTEILLQAFHIGAAIHEFAIPTFYGDEVCRVPLLKYGLNVLCATLNYRLQQLGLNVSLKFPRSANRMYKDKTKDPNSSHAFALRYLTKQYPRGRARVLDIGCGPGHVGKQLLLNAFHYTAVDIEKPTALPEDSFIPMDLEHDHWRIDITDFDCVLLLDVIEHLADPEGFLIALRNQMKNAKNTRILISTANVGFFMVRLNLLFGSFRYADRGILDITHKRLFTKSSLKKLLKETGYDIHTFQGVGIPFRTLGKGPLFKALGTISARLARLYPALFAFQFVCSVNPRLNTYQLIEMGAHSASAARKTIPH